MLWSLTLTGMFVTWAGDNGYVTWMCDPSLGIRARAGALVRISGWVEYYRRLDGRGRPAIDGPVIRDRLAYPDNDAEVGPRIDGVTHTGTGGQDAVPAVNYNFWDPCRYDKNRCVLQMLNTAEDIGQIEDEWARFWFPKEKFLDSHCPFNIPFPCQSHLTYDRVTGGLE